MAEDKKPTIALGWDYDGTLVDTNHINRLTTRAILSVLNRGLENLPPFLDEQSYARIMLSFRNNWRDFYAELGLSPEEIDWAGGQWTIYQEKLNLPLELYPGVPELIRSAGVPQGIFSINSSRTIGSALEKHSLDDYFGIILGMEDVSYSKPDPKGMTMLADKLIPSGIGTLFYLGDNGVDTECVQNARKLMEKKGSQLDIYSIRATWGINDDPFGSEFVPDHIAAKPSEVLTIIRQYQIAQGE